MDIVITIAAIAAISCLTAVGLIALPWTEAELTRTTRALAAMPEVATKLAEPLGGGSGGTFRGRSVV